MRRTLATVAVTALTVGLLPLLTAQPAAAATVSVSPTSSANNQTRTLTITGGTWPVPALEQVTLERTADTSDTIDGTVNSGASSTSSLVVDFDLTAAAPAAYNVVVSPGTAAPADSCTSCFTITAQQPTLTSMTPSSRSSGSSGEVTFAGDDLARGATVTVLRNGVADPDITVSDVSVSSPTAATATLDVAADAAAGARSLRWTNTDGQSGVCVSCLVINAGIAIDSVAPNRLGQNANREVRFTGTGFQQGATVEIAKTGLPVPPNGVTASNVQVAPDGKSLTAVIQVPNDESPGQRSVTITNPDDSSASTLITITEAPRVTSVEEVGTNDNPDDDASQTVGTARFFRFNGTGFTSSTIFQIQGATVSGYNRTQIDAPMPYIQATVNVGAAAEPGPRTVVALNADFGASGCTDCFTFTAPPTVTSVSPDFVGPNDSGTMTVNGTGFGTGATVTFAAGSGVSATGPATVAGDGESLTVPYSVTGSPDQGQVSVTVTNEDGGSGSCATCLFVGSLDVDSIAPNAASNNNGTSQSFTISGSGFVTTGDGPSVQLVSSVEGQDPIPVDLTSSSATSLQGTANIQLAAPGTYDVDVVNPGADPAAGRCSDCLTINGNDPVLTSISASRFAPGQVKTITLTGNHFSNGMEALPGVTGVTAGPVDVASPTSATVTITVASDATPGATQEDAFTVRTSDGQTSEGQDVTIAPRPTVQFAWPNNIAVGESETFNGSVSNPPNGASFQGRVDVVFSGPASVSPDDLTLESRADASAQFVDVALSSGPNGTVVGVIPPAGGNSLGANQTLSRNLRLTVDPGAPSELTVSTLFGDVASGQRVSTVATDSDEVTVRGGNANRPRVDVRLPQKLPAGGPARQLAVELDNDTSTSFPQVRGELVISGPPGLNASRIRLVHTTGGNNDRIDLRGKGGTVRARFPDSGSFALPAGAALTTTFELTLDDAAPSADLRFTARLIDVSGSGERQLASDRDVAAVNGSSARFVPAGPRRLVNSKDDVRVSGKQRGEVVVDLSSAVPDHATGVALNVGVRNPNASGYVQVYAANAERGNRAVSFASGEDQTQMTVARMTRKDKVAFFLSKRAHLVVDMLGYYTERPKAGGRFVGVRPQRVENTRGPGGNGPRSITVKMPSDVPAKAVAVLVDVTAVNPTSGGHLTVHRRGAAEPATHAVDFTDGRSHTNTYVTRMDAKRRITVEVHGNTDVLVDLVGFYRKGVKWAGRITTAQPQVVVNERQSGAFDVDLPSVPDNARAVLLSVRVRNPNSDGVLRAYASGTNPPKPVVMTWSRNRPTSNLVVARLGDDGEVTLRVNGGGTHVFVEVLGYATH